MGLEPQATLLSWSPRCSCADPGRVSLTTHTCPASLGLPRPAALSQGRRDRFSEAVLRLCPCGPSGLLSR